MKFICNLFRGIGVLSKLIAWTMLYCMYMVNIFTMFNLNRWQVPAFKFKETTNILNKKRICFIVFVFIVSIVVFMFCDLKILIISDLI